MINIVLFRGKYAEPIPVASAVLFLFFLPSVCRRCPATTFAAPSEQFPRTTIVHTYLLGHKDFVSALATVPGSGGVFMLSGGGDGMVGLWDAEAGKE